MKIEPVNVNAQTGEEIIPKESKLLANGQYRMRIARLSEPKVGVLHDTPYVRIELYHEETGKNLFATELGHALAYLGVFLEGKTVSVDIRTEIYEGMKANRARIVWTNGIGHEP